MNRPISFHWVPLKSVGAIRLGAPAKDEIDRLGLHLVYPKERSIDWETYELPGSDVRVCTEDEKISRIGCFTDLTYEGHNLIGLNELEIRKILGEPTEKESPAFGAIEWHFDPFGLTLFFKGGVVWSAFCAAEALDEENDKCNS